MNSNLKVGDNVMVIAGKDKGKSGKILVSDAEKGRVVVEGINIVHKHTKPRSQKDKGGIIKSEAGIDASNVLIICATCKKPTRIAHLIDEKGIKHRCCKKCGAVMDGEKKVKATKKDAKPAKVTEEKPAKKTTKTEKSTVKADTKIVSKATKTPVKTTNTVAKTTKRKAPVAKSQGK